MSERHITAVVLLSRSTTASTHGALRTSLSSQTRPADRVVVITPSDLPEEVREAVEADAAEGLVHEILPISAALSRAGAVHEALELLSQTSPKDQGSLSGETNSAALPSEEAAVSSSEAAAPAGEAAVSSGEAAERTRPSRRRARKVDSAAVERDRDRRAEDLSRVPQRLREERYRPGRRVGLAAGTAGESWLWFVLDGATPGVDVLERELEIVELSPNTAVVGSKRVRHVGPPSFAADGGPPVTESPSEESTEEQSTDPASLTTSEPTQAAVSASTVESSSVVEASTVAEPLATVESADALVDVGLTLTHGGRIMTGVEAGEIDQGQADWRQDVLAVPLPGMLVREQTLREVGGLDPDLPAPWAEIDLCRRVWRSGERVAVQSAGRVLHPLPTRPRLERLQEQRTGQLLVLLKHRAPWHSLLTFLLLPLVTLLRMIGAIAASSPRTALMELRAATAVLPRLRRVLARGRRDRRRARVPRGRLAPLYLPRGESMRQWLDDTWSRLFADDDRQRRIRHTTWGVAGTRHGLEDADYGRHIVWTGVVALAAAVLGLFALRGLFGRGELSGPGLRPIPEQWADRWGAAWSSWIPGGLGERGPGDALVRLLGHLPFEGPLLVEILVFAAVPASALFAWWAAGAITRAVGARLVIATIWALAPSLLAALTVGAWPLLLVHTLLPLLALAVGRAIGLPHKISQASVSAAAAGGLVLLVIGAVQPVIVLLSAVALVLVAIAAPGRRKRLLWVLLPSLALHAPYLPTYLGHPGTLLAAAGVPPEAGTASTFDLLGLWPVAPGLQQLLAPVVGETAATLLPLLPVAPVVLAALIAPLLAGAAGRVGRFSMLMAAVGLLSVLLARGTWTAVAGDQAVTPALHGLASATLLALAVGAAATFDALARREISDGRIRRALTGVIGTVVAAACLVTVAGWAVLLPGQLQLDRVEGGEVPASAADQGRTDARARVLILTQQEDGSVEAQLVVHGGDSVLQHAVIADARNVDTVAAGQPVDDDPASSALRETAAAMLSPGAASAGGEAEAAAEAAVAHLAIAYVVVQGDPTAQSGLISILDSSPQLEKVTEGTRGGMWRVVDSAPRAVVTGGTAPVPLASAVVDAAGEIPAEETERTVVLAERFDSQWRATLDGTELAPLEVDGWAQGFTVPSGAGGEIDIHREQPLRLLWQLLLYSATALTALLAIPWRIRSRTTEEMYG